MKVLVRTVLNGGGKTLCAWTESAVSGPKGLMLQIGLFLILEAVHQ